MTRNCPGPAYLFPTVSSFCPRRDILPAGLQVSGFRQEGSGGWIALVDLEELGNILDRPEHNILLLLAPSEKKILASFSYPKRRLEWLGGRIAAKSAALFLGEKILSPDSYSSLAVLPGENGAPRYVCSSSPSAPSLSLSHSGGLAAAMAAQTSSCGIDIQKISNRTLNVVSRFAAPEEVSLLAGKLPNLSTTQRLSLLWAAKEALKKSLLKDQPVLFQGVVLRDLQVDEFLRLSMQCPQMKKRPVDVRAVLLGEYILAYTATAENHA